MVLHMHGGVVCKGMSSSSKPSFENVVRNKSPTPPAPVASIPSAYIVEKWQEVPLVEISGLQVTNFYSIFKSGVIMCRFNGCWPPSELYQWIHLTWTNNYELSLYSKGFFIVLFYNIADYQKVFEEGPRFWDRAGPFITPWFPEFDPNTLTVTRAPDWVRLPNLPLHFWHLSVFEDIGNTLCSYIKTDLRA